MLKCVLFSLAILTTSSVFAVADSPESAEIEGSTRREQSAQNENPPAVAFKNGDTVTTALIDNQFVKQPPSEPDSFWLRHRHKIIALAGVLIPTVAVGAIMLGEHLAKPSSQTSSYNPTAQPPGLIPDVVNTAAPAYTIAVTTPAPTTILPSSAPVRNLPSTASTLFSPTLPSSAPPLDFHTTAATLDETSSESVISSTTAPMTVPEYVGNSFQLSQNNTELNQPTSTPSSGKSASKSLNKEQAVGVAVGAGAGTTLLATGFGYYLDSRGKIDKLTRARKIFAPADFAKFRFSRGIQSGKLMVDPAMGNPVSLLFKDQNARESMLQRVNEVNIKRRLIDVPIKPNPSNIQTLDVTVVRASVQQQPGPSKVKNIAVSSGGYHSISEVGAMSNSKLLANTAEEIYAEIGDVLPERTKQTKAKATAPKVNPQQIPDGSHRISGAYTKLNKPPRIRINTEPRVMLPIQKVASVRAELHRIPQIPARTSDSTKLVCKRSALGSCNKPTKATAKNVQYQLRHIKRLPKAKLLKLYPYSPLEIKYKIFDKARHLLAKTHAFTTMKAPAELKKIKQIMPKSSLRLTKSLSGVKGLFAGELIISSVFIGIDLKDDIPRWLTQAEVDAKIREHDDVIKYVKYIPIFWWAHLIQPMAEDNAMKVIHSTKKDIFNLINTHKNQALSHYQAFRDLPFKAGEDVGDGPWEYNDKSVLYKFSYAQLVSDFPVIDDKPLGKDIVNMLLRGGNNEATFFVITMKKPNMQQKVIKAGTMASLLLSENQAINKLLATLNDKTNFITARYIKHIFKTIDIEKTTAKHMRDHMKHGSMMYIGSNEAQLNAVEEHFRQDNIRHKNKLEQESKNKIEPIYNAIENKVRPVLENSALIQGYLATLVENQPNSKADTKANIDRLNENSDGLALTDQNTALLEKKAHPVKDSYEGEDQKLTLKQLLTLTQQSLIRMTAENPTVTFLFPDGSFIEKMGDNTCEISSNQKVSVDQRQKMTAATAVPDMLRWQRETNDSVNLFDLYQNVSRGLTNENVTSLWRDDLERMKDQPFTFFIQDANNGQVQYLTQVPAFSVYCAVATNVKSNPSHQRHLPFGRLPAKEQQLLLRDALDQDINENNIPVISAASNHVLHPVTLLVLSAHGEGEVNNDPVTFYQDQHGRLVGRHLASESSDQTITLHNSIPWQDDGSPVVLNKINDNNPEQKTPVSADILELSQQGPGHHTYSLNAHFFQQADVRAGWWSLSTYMGIPGKHQGRAHTLSQFELTEADIQAKKKIISFSVSNPVHQQMTLRPEYTLLTFDGQSSLKLSEYADRVPELEIKAELEPGAYELASQEQRVDFLVTSVDWHTPVSGKASTPDLSEEKKQIVRQRLRDAVENDDKYGDVWVDILASFFTEVKYAASEQRSGIGFTLYNVDNTTAGVQTYLPVRTVSIEKGAGLYADSIIRLMTFCKEAEVDLMPYDLGFLLMTYSSLPPKQIKPFFDDYVAKVQQQWLEQPLPVSSADPVKSRTRRSAEEEYFYAAPSAENTAGTLTASKLLTTGLGLSAVAATGFASQRQADNMDKTNDSGAQSIRQNTPRQQGQPKSTKKCNTAHQEESNTKPASREKAIEQMSDEAVFNPKSLVRWLQLNSKFCPMYGPTGEGIKEQKKTQYLSDSDTQGQYCLTYAAGDSCEHLAKDLCRLSVIDIFRSFGEQPAHQLIPLLDKLSEVQLVLFDKEGQAEAVSQGIMPYAYVINRLDEQDLRNDFQQATDAFTARCPQGSIQMWLDDVLSNATINEDIIQLLYESTYAPPNYALFGILAELESEFVLKETSSGYRLLYVSAKGSHCYQQLKALNKANLLSDDITFSLTLKGFFADERVREILNCCYSNVLLSSTAEKGFVSYQQALAYEKKLRKKQHNQGSRWFKEGLNWSAKTVNYYFNSEDVLHYVAEDFEYVYKKMQAYKNLMDWPNLAQRINKNRVKLAVALKKLVADSSVFLLPPDVHTSATSLAELADQDLDRECAIPFVFFPGQQNHYITKAVLSYARINHAAYNLAKTTGSALAEILNDEYTDNLERNAFEYLNMDMQAPDYLKKVSFEINPNNIVNKLKEAMARATIHRTTETK